MLRRSTLQLKRSRRKPNMRRSFFNFHPFLPNPILSGSVIRDQLGFYIFILTFKRLFGLTVCYYNIRWSIDQEKVDLSKHLYLFKRSFKTRDTWLRQFSAKGIRLKWFKESTIPMSRLHLDIALFFSWGICQDGLVLLSSWQLFERNCCERKQGEPLQERLFPTNVRIWI